ncbi:VWA-like domain-containing protein [Haliscomenobacter hydrossis]|uniref:Metallopeptidase domain-containing protein n=1 Tax=Haliscomenobacter hydrossis (strain ATCC 27775 / DSM 1100 / LMG 10767 / O) TaxID=760192 RepID=F4L1B2_HALH1|nr:VWA-like domain-containing protein [Haliscomenobacter hydrossis]AEE52844.1 Protein of unknown function DUF2201, metallopeptidase-related protein [Haliscomenobacter hydrossis DSM 1100]
MQSPHLLDQVSQTTIQLILHEPFYGHFLTGLVKEQNSEIATISLGVNVNKTVKLAINPDFWENTLHEPAQRHGALKHEVLHLVFRHPWQGKQFANRLLFHLAADLVVNQYLAPAQLSSDAITLERFPELELPPFRSIDTYYDTLNDALNKTLRQGLIISPALSQVMQAGSGALAGHELWHKDADWLSAAEKKLLDSHLDDLLRTTVQRVGSKGMASLPRMLQTQLQLQSTSAEPSLDWRRYLRLFFGAGQRTYLKNTIRKPSRRYGVNPGLRIRNKHKLLVILDTSDSIGDNEVQAFFNEIQHIWQQGAEIMVLECDTQINNTYIYRGNAPLEVSGRGGTNFDAALEYANQKSAADAVVYFTDGLGPRPTVLCRKPLLWMISERGVAENTTEWMSLPGRKVKIKVESSQIFEKPNSG